ncbi:MAG TPA: hypothetical protein VIN00_07325 [Candidatus Dormibacteraeota bacterium]|jgi:hypothetical protein
MRDDRTNDDRKKLAILGAVGLGLMMAARKRRWQRYAFSQMHQGPGGGPGGPGGFAGRGPWGRGWAADGGTLPPMIDAKLRAWHDQAHKQPSGAGPTAQPTGQV